MPRRSSPRHRGSFVFLGMHQVPNRALRAGYSCPMPPRWRLLKAPAARSLRIFSYSSRDLGIRAQMGAN